MGKLDQPGYPLPDGELGEDEIVCQLVYLPDRPEYWQAFLGALHYMTTWRAWERDVDKRGKDAAANWRAAFELTMGCWRMTCLEGLQQDVSDILDHIRNTVPCCGDIVIYGDSTVYITTIIPGMGDDPTHYGETAVTDWDEWSEYLCYNAHKWVDELAKQSNQLELALSVGGMSLGLAGFIVAAIVLFVVGGFLSGIVIMAIVSGVIAGYTANMFSDAADDIDDARNDIVCAIMNGTSVGDAVEDALSSGLAWDLFFSLLDYDTLVAILYEGGDGETYLEAEKRLDCDCDQIGEYLAYTDFETETWEDWNNETGWVLQEGMEGGWCWRNSFNEPSHLLYHSVGTLCESMDLPFRAETVIWINRVKFNYRMSGGAAKYQMTCAHDSGSFQDSYDNEASWAEIEEIFDPPHECTYPLQNVVQFRRDGTLYYGYIDRITVDFDYQY